jgi:hypothetical protein
MATKIVEQLQALANKTASIHNVDAVLFFKALTSLLKVKVCPRCGGSGHYSYSNWYHSSVCFKCNGYGHIGFVPSLNEVEVFVVNEEQKILKKIKSLQVANDRKTAKVQEKRNAVLEALKQKQKATLANLSCYHRELFLQAIDSETASVFVRDIGLKYHMYGTLSEKQVAAVIKNAEAVINEAENPTEYPETHIKQNYEFQGVVSSVKEKANDFGCFFQVNLKLTDGRFVTFKAKNYDDVLEIFNPAKENKIQIKVTGTVKWVSDDKKLISLSTRSTRYNQEAGSAAAA